jgi:hypothetical protein
MTAPSAPVLAVIADDDPADPILSVAFQQAHDHGAPVAALQFFPAADDRSIASRERWLFERLAVFQEQYPDLYTTGETVHDTSQVTIRAHSACLTVIGQAWLAHHRRWERAQHETGSELAVAAQHPHPSPS